MRERSQFGKVLGANRQTTISLGKERSPVRIFLNQEGKIGYAIISEHDHAQSMQLRIVDCG